MSSIVTTAQSPSPLRGVLVEVFTREESLRVRGRYADGIGGGFCHTDGGKTGESLRDRHQGRGHTTIDVTLPIAHSRRPGGGVEH